MNLSARRQDLAGPVTAVGAIGLLPWIAYLCATLPTSYVVDNWSGAWVGFDGLLVLTLTMAAWLTFRGRRSRALWSFASGLLLIADAWFDITTAGTADELTSIVTALTVELPFAAYLMCTAARVLASAERQDPGEYEHHDADEDVEHLPGPRALQAA